MKLSIVGLHHIHHTLTLNKDKLDLNNAVDHFEEKFDRTLINLTLNMHQLGVEPTLIANFSPHPKFMMPLSYLEKKGITVLPDLKDDVSYFKTIHTYKNTITFAPKTKLEMANFQHEALKASRAIITNFTSFEMLSQFSEYKKDHIIIYDEIPIYRALAFVQGIVLKEAPENLELTTKSLMQSGLSWLAILIDDYIYFRTLKHRIKLNFDNVDIFLAEFLKLDDGEVVSWISKYRID